jgi:uncharacterized protein (DUF302 family)
MRFFTPIALVLLLFSNVQANAADLISKQSPYTVQITVDRLAAAVERAGATVFARIDHAAGAQAVDMELRPTQLLIFGNPNLGTPALQESQTAGLDLPLRVVVYEDEEGIVFVAYHDPAELAEDHGIPVDAEVLKKMIGALDKLTAAAVGM